MHIGRQRPHYGGGIDAGVKVEALVLDSQQVMEKVGIGAVEIGSDPPAPIIDRQGAQPGAVAVERHSRGLLRFGHVRRQGDV